MCPPTRWGTTVRRSTSSLPGRLRAQGNRVVVVAALVVLLPAVVVGDRLRRGSGRRILRWGVSITAAVCGVRFAVHGRPSGDRRAAVVVPNHSSPLDIPALLWADPGVRFVATAGLFRVPVLAAAMRAVGTYPIDRHDHERARVQLDAIVDRAGTATQGDIAVFAEGGIAPAGARLPFKTGAFSLAIRSGSPVVPVAIHGSDRLLAPGGRLLVRPGVITVEFLDAVGSDGLTTDDRHVLRDHVEGLVHAALAAGDSGVASTTGARPSPDRIPGASPDPNPETGT